MNRKLAKILHHIENAEIEVDNAAKEAHGVGDVSGGKECDETRKAITRLRNNFKKKAE